jgi:hypothetical protein
MGEVLYERDRSAGLEIAPECQSIDEIRSKLKKEGFENVLEHLQGSAIQKELKLRLDRKI